MEETIKYLAELIFVASIICSISVAMYKIYKHEESKRKKSEELLNKALTVYIEKNSN